MAVRIRMKRMGRTHRPFYRICAFDHRTPRDGRAIEELGTYDTSIADTNARVALNTDRIDYWLSVGAQPTEKVAVLIKKYGTGGSHTEQQKAALENLAAPKSVPDVGAPAPAKEPAAAPAEAGSAQETEADSQATTEASAEPSAEAAAEEGASEESQATPEEETPPVAE